MGVWGWLRSDTPALFSVRGYPAPPIHSARSPYGRHTRALAVRPVPDTGQHLNVHHVNDGAKVIAYHRWANGGPGDDVIVVANFSDQGFSSYNIGFPSGGTWYVRFNSDWNGYDSSFGNWNSYNATANWGAKDGMAYNGNVGIGPYSIIVLSQ